MKILSLDSTAVVSTVAICENERLLAQFTINNGNTHSETLLPMIEASLKVLKLTVDDIDLFACSAGPGSFTGVRIGAATVKGLAFNKNKPCAPVSSLDALAHNLLYADGIVCPVMNARRGQLYNALFLCENGKLTRLCEDRLLSVYDLEDELFSKYADKNIYLCGDGYDIAKGSFTKVNTQSTPLLHQYQSAYSVALCALESAKQELLTTDIELSPVYLRASQAERERLERLEKEKSEVK
ncbi:MAG: tRNA (adenosine(37)-N6)-threonylcarbamoyltransferase complex dimerization subunit type 1 TsaB [Clostridia bacterium]|nr:tRNA (adenosine(37)-N6)-threonylcarbamoyltransferase complex dimerization subunit type 1 TsaB [Clostridia bacterium]